MIIILIDDRIHKRVVIQPNQDEREHQTNHRQGNTHSYICKYMYFSNSQPSVSHSKNNITTRSTFVIPYNLDRFRMVSTLK